MYHDLVIIWYKVIVSIRFENWFILLLIHIRCILKLKIGFKIKFPSIYSCLIVVYFINQYLYYTSSLKFIKFV